MARTKRTAVMEILRQDERDILETESKKKRRCRYGVRLSGEGWGMVWKKQV